MVRPVSRGGWGALCGSLVILGLVVGAAAWFGKEAPPPFPSPERTLTLTLSAERLPPSRGDHYELWVREPAGGETSVGGFRVLDGGTLVALSGDPLSPFPLDELPRDGALFVVTVEAGDLLTERRSGRVVLRGNLEKTEAPLAPVIPDLTGEHAALLAAPTADRAAGASGVWFARAVTKGSATPGLSLPDAPTGWVYGGWVVTSAGRILPTGLFTAPRAADTVAPFSGPRQGFSVPGEDFLRRAPEGLRFPPNLPDGRTEVLVSLEPSTREAPGSSFLVLLRGRIPFGQAAGKPFSLLPVSADTLPVGRVTVGDAP